MSLVADQSGGWSWAHATYDLQTAFRSWKPFRRMHPWKAFLLFMPVVVVVILVTTVVTDAVMGWPEPTSGIVVAMLIGALGGGGIAILAPYYRSQRPARRHFPSAGS